MFCKNLHFSDSLTNPISIDYDIYFPRQMPNETLLIFKPDAFAKKDACGNPLYFRIYEDISLLSKICLMQISLYARIDLNTYARADEFLDCHYAEHVGKPFYPGLKAYMQGRDVGYTATPHFMIVQGFSGSTRLLREYGSLEVRNKKIDFEQYTPELRKLILNLDANAPGAYSEQIDTQHNLLHISDSPESGHREVQNLLAHLGISR